MALGLDLSGIAKIVDSWIVDEVQIVDDEPLADGVLNDDTGQIEYAAERVIYRGRGMVQPYGTTSGVEEPGRQTGTLNESNQRYRLLLPYDVVLSPLPRAGARVKVIETRSATSDILLPTRDFEVTDLPQVSSWTAVRFLYLKIPRNSVESSPGPEPI